MNKSLLTNLVAAIILIAGFFSPYYAHQLQAMGAFALSGAVTNWLAVYMLFERVPLLYGSGVIPRGFEEFRGAIKNLIMRQFFTPENVERFLQQEEQDLFSWFKPGVLIESMDVDKLYQKLVDTVMESSFGSMLGMFGGAGALESLREPFIQKVKASLYEMVESERFRSALLESVNNTQLAEDLVQRVETIVEQRLQELTPAMVKQIVQDIIREHLGWLVVWGGVFGGLIGLLVSFF